MTFLDKPVSDLSQADLVRMIRQEVGRQIPPPLPPAFAALDSTSLPPVIQPPVPVDTYTLTYNAALGTYVINDTVPKSITSTTSTTVTDGLTPAIAGGVTLIGGPTFITATWAQATGTTDGIFYDVYIRDAADPTATAPYLYATIQGTGIVIKTLADHATALVYGDVYHIMVVPRTNTHTGSATAVTNGSMVQIDGGVDILANSVTANQIAAATITGDRIVGNTITGAQITTGLILAGTFATGTTNPKVVVDATGITIYDASGNAVFVIPSSGTAQFNGNVQTGQITIAGNMTIQGATNVMDKASKLTLNEGQGDPAAAPVVANAYDDIPATFTDTNRKAGMAYNATGGPAGASGATFFYISKSTSGNSAVLTERKVSDGSLVRSQTTDTTFTKGVAGTFIGTAVDASFNYYVLWLSGAQCKVDKYNQSWVYQSSTSNLSATPTGMGGFAFDGTLFYVVGLGGAGNRISVVTYTTTGASNSQHGATGTLLNDAGNDFSVKACHWDSTNTRLIVLYANSNAASNASMLVDNVTAAATAPAAAGTSFAINGSALSFNYGAGISWDGTNLWLLKDQSLQGAPSGWIRLSSFTWTAGTDQWHTGYVWDDGSHVTKVSPITNLSLASDVTGYAYMRGRLTITVPTFPTGITQVDTYILNDAVAGTPTATTLKLQSQPTKVTSNVLTAYRFILYDAAGANPTNTNNFGTGTSNITGKASAIAAPWNLGGDGVFVTPKQTTAARIATPAAGQLGTNSTIGALEHYNGTTWQPLGGSWSTANRPGTPSTGQLGGNTDTGGMDLYDGTNWQRHYSDRDIWELYDRLGNVPANALATGSWPTLAQTCLPDTTAPLVVTAQRLSGGTLLVKKTVTTTGALCFVTTIGAGALTNFVAFQLWSMDTATGDLVFIDDTGATSRTTLLTTLGVRGAPWTATHVLNPETYYIVTMQQGSWATTTPIIAQCSPGLIMQMGRPATGTGIWRCGGFNGSKTVRTNANIAAANQAAFSNLPWISLY